MLFYILILFVSLFGNVFSCVDISQEPITNSLNISFDQECYRHTIDNDGECCEYFLVKESCLNEYTSCTLFKDYVLRNEIETCHTLNTSSFNITYNKGCHQLSLTIQPNCCEDMTQPDCLNLYTSCHNFNQTHNSTCSIPTKYTNKFCSKYTANILSDCCENFNDACVMIYEWCLTNNPQHVSVLDLFVGPRIGHSVGSNIITFNDISNINNCAEECLKKRSCLSFDYVFALKFCHLSSHFVGDILSGDREVIFVEDHMYLTHYYEKKLIMPFPNTNCNVKNPSYIGDGICDRKGGYNSENCLWDSGDCCQETCAGRLHFFCGIHGYYCRDPKVLNPPTWSPTWSPTFSPTFSPTWSPTNHPSYNPSQSPTNHPSYNPSYNPSQSPINYPTSIPSRLPSILPTVSPTMLEIILARSTSQKSENSDDTALIVMIVINIILTLVIIGFAVVWKLKTGRTNFQTAPSLHFSNPVYEKNTPRRGGSIDEEMYHSPTDNSIYQDEYEDEDES